MEYELVKELYVLCSDQNNIKLDTTDSLASFRIHVWSYTSTSFACTVEWMLSFTTGKFFTQRIQCSKTIRLADISYASVRHIYTSMQELKMDDFIIAKILLIGNSAK